MNLKLLSTFILTAFFSGIVNAQLNVSTTPQKKNFFIERGSGIACCSCPGVTDKCMDIIHTYPKGKGVFMVYHFGPDARPQAGQLNKDYKTAFGDSILTPVWPFYLNMMVNRKDRGVPYGSTFIFGPNNDQVTPECAQVAEELSPVNLAMSSTYNATTREITVNVKAYYTANSVTPKNFLQIAITEDSIIGPQCLGSTWDYKYVHMDLFRANINGPLGATINNTTLGNTFTGTYKYTVPAKYGTGTDQSAWVTPNVKNFKLVLFVAEDLNGSNTKFGKIQNVISVPLGASSDALGISEAQTTYSLNVYPNPSRGLYSISTNCTAGYTIKVTDQLGKELMIYPNVDAPEYTIDLSSLPQGMYNVVVVSSNGNIVSKPLVLN